MGDNHFMCKDSLSFNVKSVLALSIILNDDSLFVALQLGLAFKCLYMCEDLSLLKSSSILTEQCLVVWPT